MEFRRLATGALIVTGALGLTACGSSSSSGSPSSNTSTQATSTTSSESSPTSSDESSTTSATQSSEETDANEMIMPVAPSVVGIVMVPSHWVLPGDGQIQRLNETADKTTYNLTKFSADSLINFYRTNLSRAWFDKVSDTTSGGVTKLVFDTSEGVDPAYRTTITTNATGVHVEHVRK